MNIICRQCGKEFVFTEAEQEFYEQKGFTLPQRCKECRSKKQSESHFVVCSHCGVELHKEVSIYCDTCLANCQLEYEMKIQKVQAVINEISGKLETSQSKRQELEALLFQKEQLVEELGLQIEHLSKDLEKANQLPKALNQWFQPTLKGVEERVTKRLETLERGQSNISTINERILQMAQKIYELFENITLLKLIKRSLQGRHKPSPQTT